jgi:Aspartate/tyrosine/aromatic aminotransferase
VNEGDEILIPTPYWTSYIDIADIPRREDDAAAVSGEQNYKLTPAQLDAAIKPTTKSLPVQQSVEPDRHGLHAG